MLQFIIGIDHLRTGSRQLQFRIEQYAIRIQEIGQDSQLA